MPHLTSRLLPVAAACAALCFPAASASAAPAPPLSHDVNGDGTADVAYVGAVGHSAENTIVLLVLGSRDRSAAPTTANGRVIRFTGKELGDATVIGDVNGDGLADVLVTSAGPDVRRAWVIYGSRQPHGFALPATGTVAGEQTLKVESAAGAGDVNGDGLADIVTNDFSGDPSVQVQLGDRSHPLQRGYKIRYRGLDADGISVFGVFGAGDVNGDGRDDVGLIVPDPNSGTGFHTDTGDWSLIEAWGRSASATVTADDRHGLAHATVKAGGHAAGRFVGHTRACDCAVQGVAPAGDVNGDGRSDLAVAWEQRSGSVRLDVVFGSSSGHPAIVSGTKSSGSLAATVTGLDVNLVLGLPGDVDGDGLADLLVTPALSTIVDGLELIRGRTLRGVLRAPTGKPLVGGGSVFFSEPAGDFDGDGHPDLLVGYGLDTDPGADTDPGRYAVLYGAAPLGPVGLGALGASGTVLPGFG
jgi:hypothetical protein